jgi:Cytochrome c554 and c-prime
VPAAAVIYFAPWRQPTSPPHHSPPPPDPRLTYAGPYLNVRPDVKYVGDAVCAGCHQEQHESFRHHPMGRSMMTVAEANQRAMETPEHQNPFEALGSIMRVDRDGDRVWHREIRNDDSGKPIYVNSFEVSYVVGSGNHGHSYLCIRDGYVVQTPVSWYSSIEKWKLAPGWRMVGAGRPIAPQCLFCHANRFEPVPGSLNRYEMPLFPIGASIGCERCHGPGEKHAQVWSGKSSAPTGQDFSIVNPGKLEPRLRESVCQQCHLEGEHRLVRRGRGIFDFRPGLPLDDFWSIFVKAEGESAHAVNHVEQMYQSGCFRGGSGKPSQIGCISCHDPHVKVQAGDRVEHYRGSCLKCHTPQSCKVPEPTRRKSNPQDSCIDCHMPRFPASDIPHHAATNHAIPRVPRNPVSGQADSDWRGPPIRSFFPASHEDAERDLALALATVVRRKPSQGLALDVIDRLEALLRDRGDDFELLEAKGLVSMTVGRRPDAAAALNAAIALNPRNESTVAAAALLAIAMHREDEAIQLLERAVELNPWIPEYHGNLALLLKDKADWARMKPHVEAWLRLDPGQIEARKALVAYLIASGDRDKAREEFGKIEALKPPNLDNLRDWYRERTR